MSTKTSKTYPRQKTNYPGVFYRENSKKQKIFYIRYRRPGERKIIEDKLSGYGWTPAKANTERTKRIEGTHYSNSEKRLEESFSLPFNDNNSITTIETATCPPLS